MEGPLTGLAPEHAVLLPRLLRHARSSTCWAPTRRRASATQIPAGSSAAVQVRRVGGLGRGAIEGKNPRPGKPDLADRRQRCALRGHHRRQRLQVGSQRNYGDLYQTGDNTSAVFGPSFWKVAGASMPIFPRSGTTASQQLSLLTNFPQDTAVATSGGRYTTRDVLLPERHQSERLSERLVRLRCRASPLLRARGGLGEPRTSARRPVTRTTTTTTGARFAAVSSGSRTTSRPIRGPLKFAFLPLPALFRPVALELRHRISRAPGPSKGC